ncbi:EVE domain-containing protein [Kribbella pratensis]|uniref:EVE domain-containing protein n=1 Tax=Kribbella pratensis TaxID=2512112 RepID=UPI0010659A46|nr:EVE domain-containing protein [Kribbella pratensis]
MSLPDIIRSARLKAEHAGSRRVTLEHLTPEQVEELAAATLEWLRGRPGKPSADHQGWIQVSASQAAVLSMWVADQNLSDGEQKTLRPLRQQVYDLLHARGLIEKPPGQGSSVQVTPGGLWQANARTVTRENLGAWMIKCNPKVWDLQGFLDDDGDLIEDWAVQGNYRSGLMAPGDLIFFWVTGTDRQSVPPGVWGVGHVVAPCDWDVYQGDEGKSAADGYWLDRKRRTASELFCVRRHSAVRRASAEGGHRRGPALRKPGSAEKPADG